MKNLNPLFSKAALTFSIVVLTAIAGSLIGCKQPANTNQQVLPVYQNCLNCSGLVGGQEFFRAEAKDYSNQLRAQLSFVGAQVFSSFTNYYASPVVTYTGPVAVQGALQIDLGLNSMGCIIPAGTYNVTTLQAGQWMRSAMAGVRLQALGPAQIVLSISRAQVAAKQYNQMGYLWSEIPQQGRLFGNLVIESVNGYQCQRSVLVD